MKEPSFSLPRLMLSPCFSSLVLPLPMCCPLIVLPFRPVSFHRARKFLPQFWRDSGGEGGVSGCRERSARRGVGAHLLAGVLQPLGRDGGVSAADGGEGVGA